MTEYIIDIFMTDGLIEKLGNWYPRVLAVMSCVIPFTFILGVFAFMCLVLYSAFKALR